MQKLIVADFKLSKKEVKEALYEYYVRRFKENNINTYFSVEDIDLGFEISDNEVQLRVIEEKEL